MALLANNPRLLPSTTPGAAQINRMRMRRQQRRELPYRCQYRALNRLIARAQMAMNRETMTPIGQHERWLINRDGHRIRVLF